MRMPGSLIVVVVTFALLAGSASTANLQANQDQSAVAGERAVVLGGGGLTGQAWEIGMLKGLRDAGIDLNQADLVIGTSAGSVAGTQLRSGLLDDFYDALLAPPTIGSSLEGIDMEYYTETSRMWQGADVTPASRIEVGARALAATQVIAESAFIERTVLRLGVSDWPSLPLQITATDVYDGTGRLIDPTWGVPIVHAVAASTALPGLSEPISLGASRYMDGGVAGAAGSAANGYRRVVFLAPGGGTATERPAVAVRADGSEILRLTPDADSAEARRDAQNPTNMRASAEAGRRQATLIAADVALFWNGGPTGR